MHVCCLARYICTSGCDANKMGKSTIHCITCLAVYRCGSLSLSLFLSLCLSHSLALSFSCSLFPPLLFSFTAVYRSRSQSVFFVLCFSLSLSSCEVFSVYFHFILRYRYVYLLHFPHTFCRFTSRFVLFTK